MQAVILLLLILGSLAGFLPPFLVRIDRVRRARGRLEAKPFGERIRRVLTQVLFQSKVIRERPLAGTAHALVFWGFLVFLVATTDHFLEGLAGWSFLGWTPASAGMAVRHFVALFAVAVLLGILYLAFRRFVLRPPALGDHLSWSSGAVAFFIAALMVTYLYGLYGARHGSRSWEVNWWIHSLFVLGFPPLIVRSKHLHLVLGPFAVYFKDPVMGRLLPLDFEAEETGVEKPLELSKPVALGVFSCVECGRCQDQCPAYNTGKELNPKEVILDLRKAFLEAPGEPVLGKYLDPKVIWQCTSCGACSWQCPVGVEQLNPILELRRGRVSDGEFPGPLETLFRNLERSGNPWSYPRQKGDDRIEALGLPRYEGQEVLWWMGCMGRYDDGYEAAVRGFARILRAAGVSFGVLPGEKCTGDAARRAGNEFLFAELASHNVEILNASGAARIVATCPHCVRALEEYKDLGENQGLEEPLNPEIRIEHAVRFVAELVREGRLKLQGEAAPGKVFLHDPCYLSRHRNGGTWEELRECVAAAGVKALEPGRSRGRSFCCGAGGAQVFNEEEGEKRINHDRVEEFLSLGSDPVATACPFCGMMLKDGFKDKGVEDKDRVRDVLELLAARLPGEGS